MIYEDVLDKIRAEIQENINYNKKMNYQGIIAGLLLTLDIIDKYNVKNEDKEISDSGQKRIEAICKVAHVDDIGDLSDGYHTFNQLYYQRMILFAALVKQNRDRAWKSLHHEDGELCFGGGWFIVGIDTLEGSYTYHYENKYFDLFDCEILDCGKHWDGHTEKDVTRLLSLEQEPSDSSENSNKWIPIINSDDLPVIHQDVILSLRNLDVEMGYRSEVEPYFCCHGGDGCQLIDPQNVLAWQPKPDPYKIESEV